ncbi:exopolyphosphatase [Thiohalorhabdus denitrificans]|uniref:Exopolyphosphatase n=1 Tax=Thiohalorhabdus denitrificans TaxID=381306 RepID=A0A0P9C869_9GAMM|nr:exopolyphosphatase [Thiohalorhabdus denitrificans]KPV41171.1 exopolyphosphatase [Thiohalorhabdus denitrificans]SCY35860.1 exopolyphosphatase / guanosine-5'-triphosphate,3'-diphosphate pyrophosphatase [Thiohalorhabdus denitrificans]
MASETTAQTVAAVDLGSNSFHLIVARVRPGELKVLDRLKEMVRLAGGLREDRTLDPEVQEHALACLTRFGQRLRGLPADRVRVVGTNTLRSARRAGPFLERAEEALGHPIEIVSGMEEARLIYLGVAHSLAVGPTDRRLVVDIGGGSTELIVGDGYTPRRMESLYTGCVSLTQQHFSDGRITAERFRRAFLAASQELEPWGEAFRALGWDEAVGASGTIRAAAKVLTAAGWSEGGITRDGLERLRDALIRAGHADQLDLKGLGANRAPVFASGVAILLATFEMLGIERMGAAEGALREGVLHDLMGRIRHEDVRETSVAALAERYHVDAAQAERVAATAAHLLERAGPGWELDPDWAGPYLRWAAGLHEIGLDIAHGGYHKHGAYVAANADLLGFTREEQDLLAALIRAHRRKFPGGPFKALPERWARPARQLAVLLRLAAVLHRNRRPLPLPELGADARKGTLRLRFPAGWLEEHPLTRADLEQEAAFLAAAGFSLQIE